MKPKILFNPKDHPDLNSGYGIIGRYLLPLLGDHYGRENIIIYAPVYERDRVSRWQDMRVVSGNQGGYGENLILEHYQEFGCNLLLMVGDVTPLGIVPDLAAQDKILWVQWCVTGETEVYTPWGSMPIEKAQAIPFILGWDGERVCWVRTQAYWQRTYSGGLIEIRTDRRHLCCTPEHLIFTAEGWVPAEKVSRGMAVLHHLDGRAISYPPAGLSYLPETGGIEVPFWENMAGHSEPSQCSRYPERGDYSPDNLQGAKALPRGVGLHSWDSGWGGHHSPRSAQGAIQEVLCLGSPFRGGEHGSYHDGVHSAKVGCTSLLAAETAFLQGDLLSFPPRLRHLGYSGSYSTLSGGEKGKGFYSGGLHTFQAHQSTKGPLRPRGNRESSPCRPTESAWERVIFTRKVPARETCVYDLTTQTGNFFANGILVHNCPVDWLGMPKNIYYRIKPAHKLVPFSLYGERALRTAGLPNVEPAIWLGLNTDLWKPAPPDPEFMYMMGYSQSSYNILIVAANQIRKQVRPALEAIATFRRLHPEVDVRLYLHSHQVGERDLRADVDELGLTDVVLYPLPYLMTQGAIEEWQMVKFFQCADVVMNAAMEGFGYPQLQAQACGVPVICLSEGTGPELVTFGIEIPPAGIDTSPQQLAQPLPNPVAMVAALQELWTRKRENGGPLRSQKAAQFVQDNFGWGKIAQKWFDVIDRCMEDRERYCMQVPEPAEWLAAKATTLREVG